MSGFTGEVERSRKESMSRLVFVQRREQMAILAQKEDKISQLEKDVEELKKLVKGLSK